VKKKLRAILPWISLLLGLASAFWMNRKPERAPVVALAASGGWLLLAALAILESATSKAARAARLGAALGSQSLVQLCLFFSAPFYARALKFQPIGPVRTNKRVNAPAVLLGVPLATIADGVERYAGKPETEEGRGTLFRFGFPANEQEGVLNRLRDLVASSQKKL